MTTSALDTLSESFLIVRGHDFVVGFLPNIEQTPSAFILVMDAAPAIRGLLPCRTILALMKKLKDSRFPGDLAPVEITFDHILSGESGTDFHLIEWTVLQTTQGTCLDSLPACELIVCQNQMPWRLVPRSRWKALISALTP